MNYMEGLGLIFLSIFFFLSITNAYCVLNLKETRPNLSLILGILTVIIFFYFFISGINLIVE